MGFATDKPLLTFFLLAYSISWTFFIGVGIILGSDLAILGVLGPSLALLILWGISSHDQEISAVFRRGRQVRFDRRVYLLVIPGFLAMELLAIGINEALGGDTRDFYFQLDLIGTFILQIVIIGFGEEFGWRGFALPRLQQKYNPLIASIILAGVHGFWHFPAYFLGAGTHNVPIIWFIFWIIPFTIILTWVVNQANGSVFAAAMVHGWFGVTLSAIPFLPSEDVVPLDSDLLTTLGDFSVLGAYIWMAIMFWVLALSLVFVTKGNLAYSKPKTHTPVSE